jgi:hypothetical protein
MLLLDIWSDDGPHWRGNSSHTSLSGDKERYSGWCISHGVLQRPLGIHPELK